MIDLKIDMKENEKRKGLGAPAFGIGLSEIESSKLRIPAEGCLKGFGAPEISRKQQSFAVRTLVRSKTAVKKLQLKDNFRLGSKIQPNRKIIRYKVKYFDFTLV